MSKRIALAADHRGYALKRALADRLERAGWEVVDFGTNGPDPVDYPDQAGPAAEAVSLGEVDRAIVACGSANGVAYVANRHPRVRAAIALDPEMARMSRLHNDANVLSLSADRLDADAAWPIVETWLATGFEGGRHARRIAKIAAVENGAEPQDDR